VERLIAHLAVRRVNFTASAHVGRIIARQAAISEFTDLRWIYPV
jgi:acyl-CoA reductase-like NAD-dependent aldehyde dehydrogenase